MTAYTKMQFTEMNKNERNRIANALLRYCELDTQAMVMIWEASNNWICPLHSLYIVAPPGQDPGRAEHLFRLCETIDNDEQIILISEVYFGNFNCTTQKIIPLKMTNCDVEFILGKEFYLL